MADVDITIGADTSAVSAGLAEMRNVVSRTSGEIQSILGGAFTVGTLIAGIESVINKADELHNTAARFGVDAEQLQALANVAKESGVSIEEMARAMNLLAINAQKALDPTTKQALALEHLSISAKEFATLNPQQQVLELADAYKNSAQDGAAFADVAQLIGRRNTEMVPLLAQGSQAILEQSKAFATFGDAEINELHALKIEQEKYLQDLQSWAAKVIAGFGYMSEAIKINLSNAKDYFAGTLTEESSQKKWNDFFLGVFNRDNPPGRQPSATRPVFATEEPGSATGAGGGGSTGTGGGNLAEIQHRTQLAAMDDNEKLNELTERRQFLQEALNSGIQEGVIGEATQYDLKKRIAELDGQIVPLQKKITDDTTAQSLADQKAADAIERKIKDSEGEVAIQEQINAGHQEAAALLKIELDYDDKIQKAIDAANLAYAEGRDIIGDENNKLAAQLETEKQIQVQAELGRQRAAQVGGLGQNPLGGTFFTPAKAASIATLGYDANVIAATNPRTGVVDQALLAKLRFQNVIDSQRALLGLPAEYSTGTSFIDRAQADAKARLIGQLQVNQFQASQKATLSQLQAQYAAGNYSYLATQGIANINAYNANPAVVAASGQIQIEQLSAQITIMQQQLVKLSNIDKNLTPQPGG